MILGLDKLLLASCRMSPEGTVSYFMRIMKGASDKPLKEVEERVLWEAFCVMDYESEKFIANILHIMGTIVTSI